jgi:translation initiation factor IF-3
VKDGKQLGVFPTDRARKMAQDLGLDLIEIVPNAEPPVCAILEFGKYRYEQKLREKEQRKKNKASDLKEVRLRPNIQDHDIQVKANSVKKFIQEGKKVLITLQYKNREILHKEEGYKVIQRIIDFCADYIKIEQQPKMEGCRLCCRLEPKIAQVKEAEEI